MNDQDLISKKDLLELTGISYGQLYRWKRKNLIPEDWFIRKSTFTGQETFFPRQSILSRIDKIVHMKDDLSLDELADVFSPNVNDLMLTSLQIKERNIVSVEAIGFYMEQQGASGTYSFQAILSMYILDKLLQTGEMTLDEGKGLLQTLHDHYPKVQGKPCRIVFFRKMGASGFVLVSNPSELFFESRIRVVVSISIAECVEQLNMKLTSS
ncbi:YhbD family protein [Paenibacillus rigui]|uniref:DUF4004 domain-containing protein n=1 Tax=Paenibacillus rigui TaxID=554312 RepID=A0A229UXZ0_9BACL|nr:YhbD family protein [Paenibacillus rigui]OXM88314.1 hypothetical protein CF651_00150 [Paenibacillus rigui]